MVTLWACPDCFLKAEGIDANFLAKMLVLARMPFLLQLWPESHEVVPKLRGLRGLAGAGRTT